MRGRMRDAGAFDVAVCGGGPAGLCAATAAARLGAKTALIERCAFLGGMATAGMVTPISEYNKAGQRVIGGIPWEFALRLADLGGAELGYHNGNVPFDQEIYKLAAQRMLLEAGVRLFLDSLVDGAQVDGGRVTRVRAAAKTGPFSLSAKVFLDCTGDADLAVYADAP